MEDESWKEKSLLQLVDEALVLNRELWENYSQYPPVSNSKLMLDEIKKLVIDNVKLTEIKRNPMLNVGLLASKSLDLDEDIDIRLVKYGHALHLVRSKMAPVYFFRLNIKKRRAYRFFRKHGILKSAISGYMSGIDFRKSVYKKPLGSSDKVYQWDIPCQKGDYFAPDFNSQPDCLGVNSKKADKNNNNNIVSRDQNEYELLSNVYVLDSTAEKTVDTWSITFQNAVPVCGGCRQYFNRNDKNEFQFKRKC